MKLAILITRKIDNWGVKLCHFEIFKMFFSNTEIPNGPFLYLHQYILVFKSQNPKHEIFESCLCAIGKENME